MALWLWVSARSGGLRAWVHGGSGGLDVFWRGHVRKKGGQRAQKGGNRDEQGSKRAETESAGPKGAFRRFSEVPSTTTSTVFHGFGYLGGRQGEVDGKRLGEPSGVAVIGPKD